MDRPKFIPQGIAEHSRVVANWARRHRPETILLTASLALDITGIVRNGFSEEAYIDNIASLGMAVSTANMLRSRNRVERVITTVGALAATTGNLMYQTGIPELMIPGGLISHAAFVSGGTYLLFRDLDVASIRSAPQPKF